MLPGWSSERHDVQALGLALPTPHVATFQLPPASYSTIWRTHGHGMTEVRLSGRYFQLIQPYVFGANLLDSFDLITLYPNCTLVLNVYAADGETIAWSVTTLPGAERAYLDAPENYGEQEIDVIGGAATIGQVEVVVIDPAQTRGDQDSGYLTEQLQDIYGRRCRLLRYTETGWVVIADGPAGPPRMDETYSAFRWIIKDTRETERKVPAFNATSTCTALPAGLVAPWGPQVAVTPLTGVVDLGFAGNWGGHIDVSGMWAGPVVPDVLVVTPAMTKAFEPVVEDVRQVIWYDEEGYEQSYWILHSHTPHVRIWWRYPGDTEWHKLPMWETEIGNDSPYQLLAYGGTNGGQDVVGVKYVRFADWPAFEAQTTPDLPTHGSTVEFVAVYYGEPSEEYPYHLEGITAGQLLRKGYDGELSPLDETTGLPIPTGIRYDPTALARMTDPVVMRLTEPVEDFRAWAEEYVYSPTGWIPALDNDGRISPVSQIPPADFLAEALVLTGAVMEPTPDWNAGEIVINMVKYTYPRFYVPDTGSTPGVDGIMKREIIYPYQDIPSQLRHGDQNKDYKGDVFGAVGGSLGERLGTERGALLAQARWDVIRDRYVNGAPAISVPVMRSVSAQARAGSWVVVEASWFPDYVTRRRGLLMGGQVVAIRDIDCEWRGLLIEEVIPIERGS